MSNIDRLLEERDLPKLLWLNRGREVKTTRDFEKRREEIKKILQEQEYGYLPLKPDHMRIEELSVDESFCAGKAVLKCVKLVCQYEHGWEFSFPVYCSIPTKAGPHPAFVHINFSPNVPHKFQPTESIIDRGYAVFSFCHKDITSDDGDFKNGIAPRIASSRRKATSAGKLAMWAFAAMRVMDYIESLGEIDKSNVAVIGHSHLGKSALLAGGFDERFKYIISNNSGCSGAALTRGKIGEKVDMITSVFSHWFCPRYNKNARKSAIPEGFDQHFLLALCVPRHLLVGSAEEDLWSDPASEFLSLVAVNEAYSLFGKRGLVHNDTIPVAKTVLAEGDAMYHIRQGKHYLGLEDWCAYMDYIDRFVKGGN